MAQVLVRDLRPATVKRLKARAKRNGRSLEAELRTLLENAAMELTRADFQKKIMEFQKSFKGRRFSDSAKLIREDRDR